MCRAACTLSACASLPMLQHWVQDLVRAEFRKRLQGALPRDGGSGGVEHAERAGSSG